MAPLCRIRPRSTAGCRSRVARAPGCPGCCRHGAVPVDLRTHLHRYGAAAVLRAGRAADPVLKAAGLTGRGGAAFPVHRKLAAVAHAGTRPVVIGNGAEGEPASGKDKSLLWISPHLVLDGLQLAAEAVGSAAVGLYLHRNPGCWSGSAGPWPSAPWPGSTRPGGDHRRAAAVPGGRGIGPGQPGERRPARPRFKPPMVFERGVVGRPTLVHNVETLAHLALIARFGAAWFRAAGTAAEPGSMLCTLHQADGRRDVVETELGTPLHSLLTLDGHIQAVLSGGYHGAWLLPQTRPG